MSPKTKIILHALTWTALAAYLTLAAVYCSQRKSGQVCTGLNITVLDSAKVGLMNRESVRGLLVGQRMRLTGARLDSIDLLAVEKTLRSSPYVRSARVYASLDGKLNIEVEQRVPAVRVQTETGYRFFLSEDGCVMPLRGTVPGGGPIDIPIVTGAPELPFGTEFAGKLPVPQNSEKKSEDNLRFLYNLINFVGFLQTDPFWSGQVVQIHIRRGNEVELVPRVGRGVILLGDFSRFREKLDKLYTFYRRGLAYEGWNKYTCIDLRYRGQVVCTP